MSKVVEDLVSGHNWVICPWRGLSPRGQPGCFILAGAFLFAAAWRVYASATAALAVVLLFALNPNLLYLQSTPMTEALAERIMVAASS